MARLLHSIGIPQLAAAIILVLPVIAIPAAAQDVIEGGRSVSTAQQLNRPPQSEAFPASRIPGSPHQHVYQKQGYGKPLRQGHSAGGPHGNIIIWSAAPSQVYQAPAASKTSLMRNKKAVPLTGPKLRTVPDYGKAPDDNR